MVGDMLECCCDVVESEVDWFSWICDPEVEYPFQKVTKGVDVPDVVLVIDIEIVVGGWCAHACWQVCRGVDGDIEWSVTQIVDYSRFLALLEDDRQWVDFDVWHERCSPAW